MLRQKVRAAFKQVHEAERVRDAEIAALIPIGSSVFYQHGDNEIPVTVLAIGGGRLNVRSLRSGKEYWISAFSVI